MSPPKVIGAQSTGSVKLGDKLTLMCVPEGGREPEPLHVTVVICWPNSSGEKGSDFIWQRREEDWVARGGLAMRGMGWLIDESIRWAHGWDDDTRAMVLAASTLLKAGMA